MYNGQGQGVAHRWKLLNLGETAHSLRDLTHPRYQHDLAIPAHKKREIAAFLRYTVEAKERPSSSATGLSPKAGMAELPP